MNQLRIHYLQHVPFEGPGYIETWANSHHHTLSSTHLFEDFHLPSLDAFDWLVIMGGPMGVYEAAKFFWLKKEKTTSRARRTADADYTVPAGTTVLAAEGGVAALVADHFFSGNSGYLDHGGGLITMYFHLARADVATGQRVARGTPLGVVGSTGRATGPHLHFGVRWHGARVDPALLLGPVAAIRTLGEPESSAGR